MRRALRYAFADGLFSTLTMSLVDPFLVPALLALGAGNLMVAVLSGTGLLLSGLSHLLSPHLAAHAPSRRTIVIRCVRAQAMACLLLAGAGFLGKAGFAVAVAAYAIYCSAGSMGFGLWASWMSDLVPRSGRSRYFALRSLVYGPAGGAVMLGTGLLFRALWGGGGHAPWLAFAALFAAGGAMRFGCSLFLARQHEPRPHGEKTPAEDFTYWEFLRRTGSSNFARFTVLYALLTGGAYLTGPFFATYVLRDLHCDYVSYVMFSLCAIVTSMLFVRSWARVADRWGNLFVIRVAAILLAFLPLLYLGDGTLWPMYLGWLLGGVAWSGLNLASFNFVTESATPRRRVRCYAYLQATIGITVAVYMFAWGALVDHLPVLFHQQIQTVFLCSFGLRLVPALGMIFLVREREPKPAADVLAFVAELPAVRPAADFLRELVRPFDRREG